MAPSVQTPLGRASVVYGAAPWSFTAADALAALGDSVTNTHGDHAIALRGYSRLPRHQIRSPNAIARAVVNEGPEHRLTLHQVDQARIDFAAIENDLESIRGGSPSLRRELKSGASV